MIKLTIGTPGVSDGTSYYRAAGPMSRLRQQMPGLQIDFPPAFGWHDLKSADILFIQRPGNPEHEKIIRYARQCDMPVWVDMDDDLLDVPHYNPAWEVFLDKRDLVINCLKNATVVTTATETLAKKFRQYNTNVHVIPNALDEKMLKGYDPISKKADQRTIYWRGASGHIKDLMLVEDEIVAIAKDNPKIRWQFAGYWPWHLFDKLRTLNKEIVVDHLKAVDVVDYFSYLKHHSTHSIAIVPLEDCFWNRYKSNISWLENTFAGSCVIAPEFEEFQKPGVLHYKTSFKDKILETLDLTFEQRKRKVQESLDFITETLSLSRVNRIRSEIIERLLSE